MRIINIMSSKTLGGTEQAFLDYTEALSLKNHEVFAIYNRNGKIKEKFKSFCNVKYIPSFFIKPQIILIPYFYNKLKQFNADILILHSKKYAKVFQKVATMLKVPLVVVCHNEKTKHLRKKDYIFSVTQYQKNIFTKEGFNEKKVFVIPNMISDIPNFKEFKKISSSITFGTMGRFEPIKGFITLIEATNKAKNKGLNFKIKIGGTAQPQYRDEYNKVIELINVYKLNDTIELVGWIDNKEKFYKGIDVFVMSSIHESFGIVLLEAMKYSKPIISSLAEGPTEIFKDSDAALTFEVNSSEQLANQMFEISKNLELAKKLAKNGYDLLNKNYEISIVADKINNYLNLIKK